jgi:LysR family transcriptional activator of nhaA
LPAENTTLRRGLEFWFREQQIRPRVVAECEDLALMKVMAAEGRGFIAVPTVAVHEATKRYGFQIVGDAPGCRVRLHAITTERRIHHPAATAITRAQAWLEQ